MKPLSVTLSMDRRGAALATLAGLPGDGAELSPEHLRALAATLLRVADDAEQRKRTHRGKRLPPQRMVYEPPTT